MAWLNEELWFGLNETRATVTYQRFKLQPGMIPLSKPKPHGGVSFKSLENFHDCRGAFDGQNWVVVCPSGIRIVLRVYPGPIGDIGFVKSMYLTMDCHPSMSPQELARRQIVKLKEQYLPIISLDDGTRLTIGYALHAEFHRVIKRSGGHYIVSKPQFDRPKNFGLVQHPDVW